MSDSVGSRVGGVGPALQTPPAVAPEGPVVAPDEPAVAEPDFVVQVRDPFSNSPCLSDEVRASVKSALAASFAALSDDPYVDSTCAGGSDPANQAASFGVWLTAPADPEAARMTLDGTFGRAPEETIAFYINATIFRAIAEDPDNFPADPPGGSIHLQRPPKLVFRSPNKIFTGIDGVDEDPVPDASFTLWIEDKFDGGPTEGPSNWSVPTQTIDVSFVDEAIYYLEAWGLTIGGMLIWGPLGLVGAAAGFFQIEEVALAEPPNDQGYGGAVASLLLPTSIPIPNSPDYPVPMKYPILYRRRADHNGGVQVDSTGMYAGGRLEPAQPREPSVRLVGTTEVSVHVGGGDVFDTINAVTKDFRDASFAWTVNGHPRPHSEGPSLTLVFSPSAGPFGTQIVAVAVTDADGLTADASFEVTAELTQHHGVDTGSDNPIHPA